MELVEGLGDMVLAAMRDSPTASSLVRKLMSTLFSNAEMASCSVRGKRGKPPLDPQRMEVILDVYMHNHVFLNPWKYAIQKAEGPGLQHVLGRY